MPPKKRARVMRNLKEVPLNDETKENKEIPEGVVIKPDVEEAPSSLKTSGFPHSTALLPSRRPDRDMEEVPVENTTIKREDSTYDAALSTVSAASSTAISKPKLVVDAAVHPAMVVQSTCHPLSETQAIIGKSVPKSETAMSNAESGSKAIEDGTVKTEISDTAPIPKYACAPGMLPEIPLISEVHYFGPREQTTKTTLVLPEISKDTVSARFHSRKTQKVLEQAAESLKAKAGPTTEIEVIKEVVDRDYEVVDLTDDLSPASTLPPSPVATDLESGEIPSDENAEFSTPLLPLIEKDFRFNFEVLLEIQNLVDRLLSTEIVPEPAVGEEYVTICDSPPYIKCDSPQNSIESEESQEEMEDDEIIILENPYSRNLQKVEKLSTSPVKENVPAPPNLLDTASTKNILPSTTLKYSTLSDDSYRENVLQTTDQTRQFSQIPNPLIHNTASNLNSTRNLTTTAARKSSVMLSKKRPALEDMPRDQPAAKKLDINEYRERLNKDPRRRSSATNSSPPCTNLPQASTPHYDNGNVFSTLQNSITNFLPTAHMQSHFLPSQAISQSNPCLTNNQHPLQNIVHTDSSSQPQPQQAGRNALFYAQRLTMGGIVPPLPLQTHPSPSPPLLAQSGLGSRQATAFNVVPFMHATGIARSSPTNFDNRSPLLHQNAPSPPFVHQSVAPFNGAQTPAVRNLVEAGHLPNVQSSVHQARSLPIAQQLPRGVQHHQPILANPPRPERRIVVARRVEQQVQKIAIVCSVPESLSKNAVGNRGVTTDELQLIVLAWDLHSMLVYKKGDSSLPPPFANVENLQVSLFYYYFFIECKMVYYFIECKMV